MAAQLLLFDPVKKATNEEIIQAYRETGSVWRAGKRLGMAGQSVHERLRNLGYSDLANKPWSEEEIEELRLLVANGCPLGEVAKRLGRTYGAVATRASVLGIKSERRGRPRKLPRGAGFDKVTINKRLRELEKYSGSITQYARANGLHVDPLVKACERHFPDRWQEYVASHSDIPERHCEYCEGLFVPNSGKQRFCSRKCQSDARSDSQYFSGNRRNAIGMDQGVCQLCGRKQLKGLSAHHMLGKENDPDDEVLIALCQGCHKIVSLLASRTFVDNPTSWESLISLVWMRKHGHEFGRVEGDTLYTYVEIERVEDDGEEETLVWDGRVVERTA